MVALRSSPSWVLLLCMILFSSTRAEGARKLRNRLAPKQCVHALALYVTTQNLCLKAGSKHTLNSSLGLCPLPLGAHSMSTTLWWAQNLSLTPGLNLPNTAPPFPQAPLLYPESRDHSLVQLWAATRPPLSPHSGRCCFVLIGKLVVPAVVKPKARNIPSSPPAAALPWGGSRGWAAR